MPLQLVACINSGRIGYGYEKQEDYYNKAKARLGEYYDGESNDNFEGVGWLGLDLTTGTSPEVSIKVLEAHSGIRQTSNGSRIIRRDSKVFSLFNIKWDCEISHLATY